MMGKVAMPSRFAASILLAVLPLTRAISLDLSNESSIKAAAKTAASGMTSYYHGDSPGQTPGLLSGPAQFYEGAIMWDALVNYWALTGDEQYNGITEQALTFQLGQNNDYLPANETAEEGNDDQSFWALAAMTAAERGFPGIDYNSYAQEVFDEQTARWDDNTCKGGLRWQIFPINTGYNYKNSISNGNLFQLSARLARYDEKNQTFSDWAEKVWNWSTESGLISNDYSVFDGLQATNCQDISKMQYSYALGTYLYGSAIMYNITNGSETWKARVLGLLNHAHDIFTKDNILFEPVCEQSNTCTPDMRTYKGILAGWLAQTMLAVPFTSETIKPILRDSALSAAKGCTGGSNKDACGFSWTLHSYDGESDFTTEFDALQIFQANLAIYGPALKSMTGSTSSGSGSGSNAPGAGATSSSSMGQASNTASMSPSSTGTNHVAAKGAAARAAINNGAAAAGGLLGAAAFFAM